MAGARMHFIEIIILRGHDRHPDVRPRATPTPALHAYILLVYLHSTFLHANFGWNFDHSAGSSSPRASTTGTTASRSEAIDVNFAIHFPLFDRLFGTYHLPARPVAAGLRHRGPPGAAELLEAVLVPVLAEAVNRSNQFTVRLPLGDRRPGDAVGGREQAEHRPGRRAAHEDHHPPPAVARRRTAPPTWAASTPAWADRAAP